MTDATPAPRKGLPLGFGAAFFSLFTVLGLVFVFVGIVVPGVRIEAARSWVATPCTIVSADLREEHGFASSGYSVDVSYRYVFEGTEHDSERYGLTHTRSGDPVTIEEILASIPVGSTSTCYVDPASPDRAVLHREWRGEWLLGIGGLVLALLGPIAFRLMQRGRLRMAAPPEN